jgi:hypothetical protein
MKTLMQRKSRGKRTSASHNDSGAEAFTPESAKDYVMDLHARGKLPKSESVSG